MNILPLLLIAAIATGCTSTYDARLNGTWKSNREATIAEVFRRDPRWQETSPEKAEAYKDIYGHMVLTYTDNVVSMQNQWDSGTFEYRVVDRGEDYVIIRTKGGFADDLDCRIDFDDDLSGYWIDSGWPTPEKFDKIHTEQEAEGDGERRSAP